eukprot:CAMPEP_0170983614 /NCGR_PEP_ID=MMETSP0736-20130129/4353_1 /TAXON_ID=186038 /ORGANISM="Fragilariopsis kerguelensis, Strain L26-C5" /LENGTH=325 /DNA_ID=CAMNT_0011407115 /DNA_START=111 /DNA_END=1089 /DNA_ORIENTATION=-
MNTSVSVQSPHNSPNRHEEDELSGAHFSSSSPNEVTSCDVADESSGKVSETAKWGQNDKEKEMEVVRSNQLFTLYFHLNSKYQINLLAAEYFYHRHFTLWFPTILITMFSAVCAFSIKSSLPLSEDMKGYIAFLVGCASIINVFLQNLSNELSYGHRAKSHDALALGLKQLKDELLSMANDLSEHEKLKGIEARMKTIMGQNDSNVPPKILKAYDLVYTRLSYRLFPPVLYESKDKNQTNKINRIEIYGLVFNEVNSAFNESKGWPLFIPDPDKICNRAIQKMMNELKNEVCLAKTLLQQEAIKIETYLFTIFFFKAIILSGIVI